MCSGYKPMHDSFAKMSDSFANIIHFTDEGSWKLPKRLRLLWTLVSVNKSKHNYVNVLATQASSKLVKHSQSRLSLIRTRPFIKTFDLFILYTFILCTYTHDSYVKNTIYSQINQNRSDALAKLLQVYLATQAFIEYTVTISQSSQ